MGLGLRVTSSEQGSLKGLLRVSFAVDLGFQYRAYRGWSTSTNVWGYTAMVYPQNLKGIVISRRPEHGHYDFFRPQTQTYTQHPNP